MEVFVTHGLSGNSGLARAIEQAGARALRRKLEGIEAAVKQEIEAEIAQDFNNGRSGFLSKGDTKLLGSIIVQLEGEEFPFTLSVGSHADPGKVGALEFGSHAHTIEGNPLLYFESARIGRGKAAGIGAGRSSGVLGPGKISGGVGSRGGSSRQLTKTPSVRHPGNRPYRFMRIGLERAVRIFLGTR